MIPDPKWKLFSFQTSEGNTVSSLAPQSVYLPVTLCLHTQRNKHTKIYSVKDHLQGIAGISVHCIYTHTYAHKHICIYTELNSILIKMYPLYSKHTLGQYPCPRVVGWHKMSSMVFLFHFGLFCLSCCCCLGFFGLNCSFAKTKIVLTFIFVFLKDCLVLIVFCFVFLIENVEK